MKGILLLAAALTLLTACQTTQQKAAQLAAICSQPGARDPDPDNLYYAECLAVDPKTDAELQQDWYQTSPEGY